MQEPVNNTFQLDVWRSKFKSQKVRFKNKMVLQNKCAKGTSNITPLVLWLTKWKLTAPSSFCDFMAVDSLFASGSMFSDLSSVASFSWGFQRLNLIFLEFLYSQVIILVTATNMFKMSPPALKKLKYNGPVYSFFIIKHEQSWKSTWLLFIV